MKSLVIKATTSTANLGKFSCNTCGGEIIGSADLEFCPHCGEEFKDTPKKVKTSISASLDSSKKAIICCASCNTKFNAFNTPKTSEELAISLYCPVCGNDEMSVVDNCDEDCDENTECTGCDENAECVNECDDECDDESDCCEQNSSLKEFEEAKEDKVQETEKDIQDVLNNEQNETTVDNLQWKTVNDSVNGENGTLIAFSASTGLPVFVFKKDKCNSDIQSIFASSSMISGFNQISKSEGIGSALEKFGGSIYKNSIIESSYINDLAIKKATTELLPKLVECMALAAEGAIKGMYPEVRKDLYNSLINELQGSGIPVDRIEAAIRTTMGNGGTTAYASLLSKAMDLMKKDDNIFEETKSMICGASNINMSNDDIEQYKIRTALNASSIRINEVSIPSNTSMRDSEVEILRKKLNFGNKFCRKW